MTQPIYQATPLPYNQALRSLLQRKKKKIVQHDQLSPMPNQVAKKSPHLPLLPFRMSIYQDLLLILIYLLIQKVAEVTTI